ncbi:hypothetical protein ACIA6D_13525 [Streptomyces cacaoi]
MTDLRLRTEVVAGETALEQWQRVHNTIVLGARVVETCVPAVNEDGLRFARARGSVEVERYVLDGGTAERVDLRLLPRAMTRARYNDSSAILREPYVGCVTFELNEGK